MQRTHRSLLAIAIVTTTALALVMVGHRNVAQANDEGCNASTVKGAYGFAIGGFVSTTFSGDPQQAMGWLSRYQRFWSENLDRLAKPQVLG